MRCAKSLRGREIRCLISTCQISSSPRMSRGQAMKQSRLSPIKLLIISKLLLLDVHRMY